MLMLSRITSRQTFLISILAILAIFTILFLNIVPTSSGLSVKNTDLPAENKTSVQNSSTPLVLNTRLPESLINGPVRLRIPSINVDAAVEHVGLVPNGAMDVPKNPSNAAWYKLGKLPGENGTAVIDGHYGRWANGQKSVFDNLSKLRIGDKIYVEDNRGGIVAFVVRESRSYEKNADASNVFNSSDGKSHLNLITCEGTWDKISKSYSSRLVIFTDKEFSILP